VPLEQEELEQEEHQRLIRIGGSGGRPLAANPGRLLAQGRAPRLCGSIVGDFDRFRPPRTWHFIMMISRSERVAIALGLFI